MAVASHRRPFTLARRHTAALLGASLLAAVLTVPPTAVARPLGEPRPPLAGLTTRFEAMRAHASVWGDDRRFESLLAGLQALRSHGLDPAHYGRDRLVRLRHDPAAREQPATEAWFAAALDLLHGRVDPREHEPDWNAAPRVADLPARLNTAIADGDIAGALLSLAPTHVEYAVLRAALTRLLDDPDPPAEPLPKSLDPLHELAVTALLADPDASLGPPAASRPEPRVGAPAVAERIARLRVNLERWRWLPEDLGRRHVRVNLAAYRVTRREDGRVLQRHRAIVGSSERQTPVFSDKIRRIVFNPWWETPHSIAVRDELPVFRRYPRAPRQLGFQVLDAQGRTVDPDSIDWSEVPASPFPYRLRQAPGPLNALGRAKILFPNAHDVYLHDTAAPELFFEREREFSSGCVRTDDIATLSAWLLEDTPGWDARRVREVMRSGRTVDVALTEPVPVHLLYFTAEPDPARIDGSVLYLEDIYERDARLLRALGTGPAANGMASARQR